MCSLNSILRPVLAGLRKTRKLGVVVLALVFALISNSALAAWTDTKNTGDAILASDWNAMVTATWDNSNGNAYRTTGKVGIGTTAPNRSLQIHDAAGVGYFQMTSSTSGTTSTDGLEFNIGTDASIWNYETGYLRLGTANTEGMRIQSDGDIEIMNGNVGIGTTDPQGFLDVRGSICLDGGTDCRTTWPTAADTGYWTQTGSDVYYTTGNVGIGTTAPVAKLEIETSGAGSLQSALTLTNPNSTDGGTAVGLHFLTSAGGQSKGLISFLRGAKGYGIGHIIFAVDNTSDDSDADLNDEVMRITNTGKVGIGTTAPTAVLHTKAGTATAGTAPLKLTSGTNLTTPEAGAIEFDGTNLYYTDSTPTRQTLATGTASAPTDAKYIVQQADDTLSAEQALGALATGILKNTTSTGILSIAAEGTDYYGVGATDVAVADGGTGASTASAARSNLGAAASGANADITSTTALTSITRATGGTFNVALSSAAGDDFTVDTDKLVVEGDTGNVGIGTTAPTAQLHTKGNLSTALTGTVAVTNASVNIVGTSTTFGTDIVVGDSIKIESEIFTVSTITDATHLALDSTYAGSTASGLTAYSDSDLFAIDNGDAASKMVVTKSGKVGIGNTAPRASFQIGVDDNNVPAIYPGQLLISNPSGSNAPDAVNGIEISALNGYGVKLYTHYTNDYFGIATRYGSATWTERFAIKEQTGNVGIGVTDPDTTLEIYKVGTQLKLSGGAADYATFATADDGALTITTVDVDAAEGDIILSPDGNVGIGTDSPGARLHLKSSGGGSSGILVETTGTGASGYASIDYLTPTGENGFQTGMWGSNNGDRSDYAFFYNNTINGGILFATQEETRMLIDKDGNVGIGITNPSTPLNVVGSVFPVGKFERTSTSANETRGALGMKHTTTNNMTDGFGPSFSYFIEDNAGVENAIASISAIRDGADNTGAIVFKPYLAGSAVEVMRMKANGNVGIGTTSPDTKLDVAGAITQRELSANPTDPDEGSHVVWQSDGTGSGDDGDIMVKITAGAVTKTITLIDFSAF